MWGERERQRERRRSVLKGIELGISRMRDGIDEDRRREERERVCKLKHKSRVSSKKMRDSRCVRFPFSLSTILTTILLLDFLHYQCNRHTLIFKGKITGSVALNESSTEWCFT